MQITFKDEIIKLDHGEMLEIPEYIDRYQIHTDYDSIIVVAGGIWDDPAGSSGVFTMLPSKAPENTGDPSEYNRNTRFDRHFHDCDEYWIITQGNCVAEIDGVLCALTPGNCLYIPKGVSHDLLRVPKMVSGVYIETSMKGQRRSGHLWKHTHG
ncbi:MAG: cupin domain-containing protein [Candidatus Marinimicrobia bacterium]|nr:cupin domain-containing protein [Candidatus Neomarinimicrobiota bacterium]